MAFAAIRSRLNGLSLNLRGAVFLMFAAFFFAVMVSLIKLLGQNNYHITQILLVRQLVMTLIVLPVIWRDFPDVLKTNKLSLQLFRIALGLTAMLLGFSAVIHLNLADATALGFAKSFFVTIFAVLILKEAVGFRRWAAVAMGFLGVLVMLRPGADAYSIYGLFSVMGAACAGLVMIIIRFLSRTDSPTTILTFQALGVGLVIAIPAIWYWQWPTMADWIILIAMGIVSYFSQICNIYAYKWGEASLLASLDYVRLLYATILGYFLFANLPGIETWIGAAIIITASIYTIRREAMRKQSLVRGPQAREYDN